MLPRLINDRPTCLLRRLFRLGLRRCCSFTITNPGAIGGTTFTPIINYPEVAILGLARSRLEPVVQGDIDNFTIAPRLCLPLHLAFDHRVNDGADAARFMRTLIDTLHDPEAFLLRI